MYCIGDECVTHRSELVRVGRDSAGPLFRTAAIGALCAGLGYAVAQHGRGPQEDPALHVAALAPPLVMVAPLGE